MSLPVEILRALIASGASAEVILAAAEAADARERAAQAEAERKDEERRARARESNRTRQRAWYDRHVRNNEDNAVSSSVDQANQDNGVRGREVCQGDDPTKGPQTPKNSPEDITPSLPSEALAPLPAKPRRFDWPSDFEDRFWAAYPRHTDRKKAMVALGKVRRADRVAFDDVIAGCDRLRDADIELRFLPHATTWLNNERWTDEIPGRRPPPSGPPPGRGNGFGHLAAQKRAARQTEDGNGHATQHHADRPVRPPQPGTAGSPQDDARGGYGDGPGQILDLVARRAYG